jgi:hypothetical protein
MQSETKLKSFLNTKKLYGASLHFHYSFSIRQWRIGGLLFANDRAVNTMIACSISLDDVIEFDEKNNLVVTKDKTFEIILKEHHETNFWSMLKDKTGLVSTRII